MPRQRRAVRPRSPQAAQNQAVEQRTQQRLAARREAAQRGVETRRRNREAQLAEVAAKKAELKRHEAKLAAESKKMRDAESAAGVQGQQAPVADRPAERPGRNVAQAGRARPGGQASGPMVTVALRGESAQRLRALAAAQEMTLSKLLVRMMEVFEAQAIQRGRDAAQRELPLPPRCAILASILSLGRGIVPRPRALGDL